MNRILKRLPLSTSKDLFGVLYPLISSVSTW